MRIYKVSALYFFTLCFSMLFLIACSNDDFRADINSVGKITVRVGFSKTYHPFAYLKDGIASGFDTEVVRAINTVDQNIYFEFIPKTWKELFSALENNEIDMIANQVSKTEERASKYLFNELPYFISTSQFIVDDRSNTRSISELRGLTSGRNLNTSHGVALEKWNNENGKMLTMKDYNSLQEQVDALYNGDINVIVEDPIAALDFLKDKKLNVRVLEYRIETNPVHFVFRQNDTKLSGRINNAIQILRENGTLTDLSKKWFNKDYTK